MDFPEESMAVTKRGMTALHAVRSLPQIGISSLYELIHRHFKKNFNLLKLIQCNNDIRSTTRMSHSTQEKEW